HPQPAVGTVPAGPGRRRSPARTLRRGRDREDLDRLVFGAAGPFPGTGLDLVGDHDHPIVSQPRHALDRTVDGTTAGVGREPVDGALVGDLVDEVRAVSA